MSIAAQGDVSGTTGEVIATRNGVPPPEWQASEPPGGIPRPPPDTDPAPHHVPTPAEEQPGPGPQIAPELPNEPPEMPPQRVARGHQRANKG